MPSTYLPNYLTSIWPVFPQFFFLPDPHNRNSNFYYAWPVTHQNIIFIFVGFHSIYIKYSISATLRIKLLHVWLFFFLVYGIGAQLLSSWHKIKITYKIECCERKKKKHKIRRISEKSLYNNKMMPVVGVITGSVTPSSPIIFFLKLYSFYDIECVSIALYIAITAASVNVTIYRT